MKNRRIIRVNETVRRAVAAALYRQLDPAEVSLAEITVTQADTSPDLRHATVLVSIAADTARQHAVMAVLARKRAAIQRDLSRHVILKYTPHLHFRLDPSIARGDRILALIETLAPEGDEPPPSTTGGERPEDE